MSTPQNEGEQKNTPPSGEDQVKQELEYLRNESDKLKKELEDTRLEIMTPEYIDFLNTKDAKAKDESKPASEPKKDDYEGLTQSQLVAKLRAEVAAEADKKIQGFKDELSNEERENVKREIATFAKSHDDFELYRPTMYGLSLKPENKGASLNELYQQGKELVKRIHKEPTEAEKQKAARSQNEKPGGSSGSFDPDKKYTAKEAGEEAWAETVGDGGLPPSV